MAKTFEELKSQANLIKNETKPRANSATRVGGTIFDMVEKVEDEDTETKKLIKGQSANTDPKTDPHKWIDEINVDEEGEKELKALLDGMASREGVGFYRGSFSGSLFEVETIAVSYDEGNYTQSVRGSLSISSDGTALQYGSTYKILTRVCTGNKWSTWRDLAQPDSMPISGFVNLTEVKAYNTLTTTAKALANNTMKYYLITDSKGVLPSVSGETKITMYSTVGKLFHPSQNSVGASVGDIAVVAKINDVAVYYVQPRYEAKAPSGDFPGCDGLMSAGDKQTLNTAKTNSDNAIKQIDQSCFRCYNGTYNANNCFWYGYYMYVNFGRPAGSEDGENYLLRVADIGKTSDNKFVIEQTLYSSKYATKIFRRIIIVTDKRGPADASNVVYTEWERVGSNDEGLIFIEREFPTNEEPLTEDDKSLLFKLSAMYSAKNVKGLFIHNSENAFPVSINLSVYGSAGTVQYTISLTHVVNGCEEIATASLMKTGMSTSYQENWSVVKNEFTGGSSGSGVNVVQKTGYSEEDVMSQKAVTEAIHLATINSFSELKEKFIEWQKKDSFTPECYHVIFKEESDSLNNPPKILRNGVVFFQRTKYSSYSSDFATFIGYRQDDSNDYGDIIFCCEYIRIQDGNIKWENAIKANNIPEFIAQTTGDSTTAVMCQKAVTDAIGKLGVGFTNIYSTSSNEDIDTILESYTKNGVFNIGVAEQNGDFNGGHFFIRLTVIVGRNMTLQIMEDYIKAQSYQYTKKVRTLSGGIWSEWSTIQ